MAYNTAKEEELNVPVRPKDFGPDARPTSDILFGIDELLDVRLGTLARINPELAAMALNSGKYFDRVIDEFPGITEAEFREHYDKRDADTLPLCVVTNVALFLERIVKDALVADASGDLENNAMVFSFNTWPYELEQEEIDMMVKCVEVITLGYGEIKVVHYSPKDLSPQFLRDNYDIVFSYDYDRILAEHDGEFVKMACPGVSVICPTLYRGTRPDKAALEYAARAGKSLFEMTRLAMVRFIGLKFQPTSLFCISERINPENKETITKAVSITADDLIAASKAPGTNMVFDNLDEIKKPEEPQAQAEAKEVKTTPAAGDDYTDSELL